MRSLDPRTRGSPCGPSYGHAGSEGGQGRRSGAVQHVIGNAAGQSPVQPMPRCPPGFVPSRLASMTSRRKAERLSILRQRMAAH